MTLRKDQSLQLSVTLVIWVVTSNAATKEENKQIIFLVLCKAPVDVWCSSNWDKMSSNNRRSQRQYDENVITILIKQWYPSKHTGYNHVKQLERVTSVIMISPLRETSEPSLDLYSLLLRIELLDLSTVMRTDRSATYKLLYLLFDFLA